MPIPCSSTDRTAFSRVRSSVSSAIVLPTKWNNGESNRRGCKTRSTSFKAEKNAALQWRNTGKELSNWTVQGSSEPDLQALASPQASSPMHKKGSVTERQVMKWSCLSLKHNAERYWVLHWPKIRGPGKGWETMSLRSQNMEMPRQNHCQREGVYAHPQ